MSDPAQPAPSGDDLRPHTYDGIREYDKRLPNWWLWTLYLTIIFATVYWFYYFTTRVGLDDQTMINQAMGKIEVAKLASVASLNDDTLWKMSRNAAFVEAGLDDATVAATGRRFRATVLGEGGSRHPLAVFRDFRGREPSPEALLRQCGLLN